MWEEATSASMRQPSVASRRERSIWDGFEGHVRQTGGEIGRARGVSDPHLTGPLRGETRCTITLVDVSGVCECSLTPYPGMSGCYSREPVAASNVSWNLLSMY